MKKGYRTKEDRTSKNSVPPHGGSSIRKEEKTNKSVGKIIDEILENPQFIMKSCNEALIKAKKEAEKVANENKTLEEAIIEKDKEISYLKGKVDTMKDVISELNAARYIESCETIEEK